MGKPFSSSEKAKLQTQAYGRSKLAAAFKPPYLCPDCGTLNVYVSIKDTGVVVKCINGGCKFSHKIPLQEHFPDKIDYYNFAVDELEATHG